MNKFLKIAKDLESKFVSLDSDDDKITEVFASAIVSLKAMAEEDVTSPVDDLHAIAALAAAFDKSGDPELQAEASYLDEILFAIAAPKAALAGINLVYDKELETLRSKMRGQDRTDKYTKPKEELDIMYGSKAIAQAVKEQVDVRRPLEDPLSTRYSPDRPGVSLMRITDGVYQDPTTGKIYDYKNGYTTDKGNEVPGTAVENQIPDINEHQSRSLFTTREGLLSSASKNNAVKTAQMKIPEISSIVYNIKKFLSDNGINSQIDIIGDPGLSLVYVAGPKDAEQSIELYVYVPKGSPNVYEQVKNVIKSMNPKSSVYLFYGDFGR